LKQLRSLVLVGGALALGQACSSSPSRPPRLGDEGGGGYGAFVGSGGTTPKEAGHDAATDGTGGAAPDAAGGAHDAASDGPVHCHDGVQDGGESDVDCGGLDCAACADGKKCGLNSDCASHLCNSNLGTCAVPSCSDGIQNGDETDIDCGGSCSGCATGQHCVQASDCESGNCTSGKCQ
jgi:hypothetical protein